MNYFPFCCFTLGSRVGIDVGCWFSTYLSLGWAVEFFIGIYDNGAIGDAYLVGSLAGLSCMMVGL